MVVGEKSQRQGSKCHRDLSAGNIHNLSDVLQVRLELRQWWKGPHLCRDQFMILSLAFYLTFLLILGPWRRTRDVTESLSVS